MREREAKLTAGPAFAVPSRGKLGPRVASAATDEIHQHAVYYDSRDLRLVRSGASLRFRSDDGWTVKLPVPTDAGGGSKLLVRNEHSFSGGPGAPPAAASNLVHRVDPQRATRGSRLGRYAAPPDAADRRRRVAPSPRSPTIT